MAKKILLGFLILLFVALIWFSIDTMWWHVKMLIRGLESMKLRGEYYGSIEHDTRQVIFIFLSIASLVAWCGYSIYLFVKSLLKK